jgi:hypothetical protein
MKGRLIQEGVFKRFFVRLLAKKRKNAKTLQSTISFQKSQN